MTVAVGSRSPAASSLRGVPVPRGSPAVAPGGRPPGGAAVITIRLLGRFAVERDGQEIARASFGGRLARQLLRLLALQRGTLVAKELIADALWRDHPPADPAGNIEVLVSRIRRAVGDRTLVQAGPAGYVLAGGGRCWVDAEAFLSAVQADRAALAACPADRLALFRAALGIWRGEPLPEDTYADWAQADRRRLGLAYLEALDGAAAAALESAGAAAGEAEAWAGRAVAAEPLREPSVLLLVRALAAAGDQAGALAAFDRYRDRLAAETGLDPTPQAIEIRQHVLDGRLVRGQQATSRTGPPSGPRVQGQPIVGVSDQFSLAVIAYEMLTGEKPYTGEHLTYCVHKIVAEEPTIPHRLKYPSLSAGIDAVLRKALSKKPDGRYRTCSEFSGALEKACAATKNWKAMSARRKPE